MIVNKKESSFLWVIDILMIIAIMLFFMNLNRMEHMIKTVLHPNSVENFTIIFLSIILEAIPFVLIGAFVSSIIQLFVSEQLIARLIPRNKWIGLLAASLLGLIFPVCECAIIPVVRRLMKKGMPVYIAITFMLAVPIINPIVLLSTYYAFSGQVYMVFMRAGFGMVGAIAVGYLIDVFHGRKNPLREDAVYNVNCSCGCTDGRHEFYTGSKNRIIVVRQILEHTSRELYDVGKYLIIGAFLSAFMQTFIERKLIASIGRGPITSILVLMGLAFILSLCSEADAFIARTFMGQFTTGAITAFLVFGPMLDLKNTMMLMGTFKGKFVIKLIALIVTVCVLIGIWVNVIFV